MLVAAFSRKRHRARDEDPRTTWTDHFETARAANLIRKIIVVRTPSARSVLDFALQGPRALI
jgi:hypothetical protein